MMNFMNEIEVKNANGGAVYRCKFCGQIFTSYVKAYAHSLICAIKQVGR